MLHIHTSDKKCNPFLFIPENCNFQNEFSCLNSFKLPEKVLKIWISRTFAVINCQVMCYRYDNDV